jgi:hypothetical protein
MRAAPIGVWRILLADEIMWESAMMAVHWARPCRVREIVLGRGYSINPCEGCIRRTAGDVSVLTFHSNNQGNWAVLNCTGAIPSEIG